MKELEVSWTEIKTNINNLGMDLRYVSTDKFYYIKASDGVFYLHCDILKNNSADQIDFESNYKTGANKPLSAQDISGIRDPNGMRARLIGTHKATATKDSTTNHDWKIPQLSWLGINKNSYFDGIEYLAMDAKAGDGMTLQVVDKDGVGVTLGWYSQAAFDTMGNLHVVEEFGTEWGVVPDVKTDIKLYKAMLIPGLYLRIKYISTSTVNDAYLICNIFRHLDGGQ